jgi:co-chaperonin GroES (HSP10)
MKRTINNMSEVTTLNPFLAHENTDLDADLSKLDLPGVVGHNLLILPIKFEEKTKSGLILTEARKELDESRNTVGKVLAMGPTAYRRDKVFFDIKTGENYPYCKVGDWIAFSKLGNVSRIEYGGVNYWVIADTQVLYTVPDPNNVMPGRKVVGFDFLGDQQAD